MRTSGLLVAAIGALPALAGGCTLVGDSAWNGVHVSGGAGYLQADLSGQVDTITEVSPGVDVTTEFDFEDNGGQDDEESQPYLVAQVGFAPLELRASAFRYQSDATGTFTGDFLGTTFVSGTVETEFDIGVYQATLGLDLLNLERLRLAVLAGATVLDLDLAVSDTGVPGIAESIEETVPIPVVGARGDLKVIGSLRVGATVSFLPDDVYEYEGIDVAFLDLEGGVFWGPLPFLEVFGIYRSIDVDAEGEVDDVDASMDLLLEGPVLGVALTF